MRRHAAIGLLALVVAGCGGDESPKPKPPGPRHRAATPAEAADIRATVAELEGAIAHRDAPAVCRLYTRRAREQATLAYATCATAVRSDLRREPPARLTVGAIVVSYDTRERPRVLRASATVTSAPRGGDPFELDARLAQESGGWRIEDEVARYLVKPAS
jgi:hypothetical protein